MSSISNVPSVTITEAGVDVPETPKVLAGVLKDYNVAFGGNLNIENVATPQGYLAQETTANIAEMNAALAWLFNNVDPAYASGRMQDAIARIYFLSRKTATKTTVQALCTGSPGVTLPTGSRAQDDDGNTYTSISDAAFDQTGQLTVTFSCDTTGPIVCPAGGLTKIIVAVSGWDAVTNLDAGIPGMPIENRSDFERRRYQSVSGNATGTSPAILGAVFDLPDVTDCYVIENFTNEVKTVGETNYPLSPHSIYVGVVGGDEDNIAKTIWRKKDLGCNMNGNTIITVYDDSGLATPYPEYQITFNRPAAIPIKFSIILKNNSMLPSDIKTQIQNAVIDAFNGGVDGIDRERMGSTIFASTYYGVVSKLSAYANIISVLIGFDAPEHNTLQMGIDQYPTISTADIEVILQ